MLKNSRCQSGSLLKSYAFKIQDVKIGMTSPLFWENLCFHETFFQGRREENNLFWILNWPREGCDVLSFLREDKLSQAILRTERWRVDKLFKFAWPRFLFLSTQPIPSESFLLFVMSTQPWEMMFVSYTFLATEKQAIGKEALRWTEAMGYLRILDWWLQRKDNILISRVSSTLGTGMSD